MAERHSSTVAGAPPNGPTHHEGSDVDIVGIFTFVAGLIVSAVVIQLVVWLLFRYFSGREELRTAPQYPLAATQETRVPPEPRLQTNPRGDLLELRTHEEDVLGSYGWVDKGAGVVRIPIDEAMRLTLQRGLPARREPGSERK
jgi:hypothetical protein